MAETEHYTSDGVIRGVDVLIQREVDLQSVINTTKSQLKELAATFVDIEAADKVPGTRDLLKGLLEMENEVNMHVHALQSTKGTYKASEATTDFAALLKDKTRRLLASQVFDPEQSADLRAFDQDTGIAGNAAGNDDDDVVDMNDDMGLKNDKCPLTMKSVWELEQPVQDKMVFIYEMAAIVQHIRRHGRAGTVKCPVSGTNHDICERDLKPAGALLERLKRRKRLRQGAQGQQRGPEAEAVFDADNL